MSSGWFARPKAEVRGRLVSLFPSFAALLAVRDQAITRLQRSRRPHREAPSEQRGPRRHNRTRSAPFARLGHDVNRGESHSHRHRVVSRSICHACDAPV
jgi:hypothetical protein